MDNQSDYPESAYLFAHTARSQARAVVPPPRLRASPLAFDAGDARPKTGPWRAAIGFGTGAPVMRFDASSGDWSLRGLGLVPLGAGSFDVCAEIAHQATQERNGLMGLHGIFRLSQASDCMGGSANTQGDVAALLGQFMPVLGEDDIGCRADGAGEAKGRCICRRLGAVVVAENPALRDASAAEKHILVTDEGAPQ